MLSREFYVRDATKVAKDLLGCVLCTNIDGVVCKGMIVETEAYADYERACHAYGGTWTERTSTLYMIGGTAYVYLIYGMYNLFNVVTNEEAEGEAVLIRAVEPLVGLDIMMQRRGAVREKYGISSGPGKLTIAMGIDRSHNKIDLVNDTVWIDPGIDQTRKIIETTRIGVDYAGEDALLPWRYYVDQNPWVSRTI